MMKNTSVLVFLAAIAMPLALLASTPKTSIDQAYAAFTASVEAYFSWTPEEREKKAVTLEDLTRESYYADLADFQKEALLKQYSDPDLELLQKAAYRTFYMSNDENVLEHIQIDVNELRRRHAAKASSITDLWDAYMQGRRFDDARELTRTSSVAGIKSVPDIHTSRSFTPDKPATFVWNKDESRFDLSNIDVGKYDVVVVSHPQCHFTENAVVAINADKELGSIMKNSLWLVSQEAKLDTAVISAWNASHRDQQMEYVYKNSAWPQIDEWATPIFYFMKNGKVVHKIVGWPADGSTRQAILDWHKNAR